MGLTGPPPPRRPRWTPTPLLRSLTQRLRGRQPGQGAELVQGGRGEASRPGVQRLVPALPSGRRGRPRQQPLPLAALHRGCMLEPLPQPGPDAAARRVQGQVRLRWRAVRRVPLGPPERLAPLVAGERARDGRPRHGRKTVMLPRLVALPVSLTLTVSPPQNANVSGFYFVSARTPGHSSLFFWGWVKESQPGAAGRTTSGPAADTAGRRRTSRATRCRSTNRTAAPGRRRSRGTACWTWG